MFQQNKRDPMDPKLNARLDRIQHKIIVLSGKGGVGKSTIAVNLAVGLTRREMRTGLLDLDIHGPSIPTMLGLEGETIQQEKEALIPVTLGNLKVMSIGFLLRNPDDPVIWRGPLKMGVIKQFLKDVDWGDLDYLIIDSPPGTGDEPLSICQLIGNLDGAIVVTTPQKVSLMDARKAIMFCRRLHVPILGLIENMSGFICPKCGEFTPIFQKGGGKEMANQMGVHFLGDLPLDPNIAKTCDTGLPFIERFTSSPMAEIIQKMVDALMAASK